MRRSGGLIGLIVGGCWLLGHDWLPAGLGRIRCEHCGTVR